MLGLILSWMGPWMHFMDTLVRRTLGRLTQAWLPWTLPRSTAVDFESRPRHHLAVSKPPCYPSANLPATPVPTSLPPRCRQHTICFLVSKEQPSWTTYWAPGNSPTGPGVKSLSPQWCVSCHIFLGTLVSIPLSKHLLRIWIPSNTEQWCNGKKHWRPGLEWFSY